MTWLGLQTFVSGSGFGLIFAGAVALAVLMCAALHWFLGGVKPGA